MKKLFISILFLSSLANAALVDAIAIVVNDTPITLYDIEKKKQESNVSKEEAVSQLIDKALFEELVRKYNINVDVFDVNNYLEKLAASNGMDLYDFKAIIKQKYKSYESYEEEIKQQIAKQRLTEKLVRGNLKVATEEDLKIYYDNNQSQFQSVAKTKAIQFSTMNKADLEKAIKNPMANLASIKKVPVELDQKTINPQLKFLLNETATNSFTPIFRSNNQFVTLMIQEKIGVEKLEFEKTKDKIFNIVMKDRETKYLKDYFEKLKLSADIKVVR